MQRKSDELSDARRWMDKEDEAKEGRTKRGWTSLERSKRRRLTLPVRKNPGKQLGH
jgi:hypothetical protein